MSADLVRGWATIGFVLMVPATLLAGYYDRRLLAGVKDAEILAKEGAEPSQSPLRYFV